MNRYATQDDVNQFASLLSPNGWEMKVDDYIFDTFTASSNPKRIMLTKAETELANLKDGATVWLHASALKDFECIILTNETNGRPWPIENVNFRPIPDAQLKLKRGPQSYSELIFKVHGVKFPRIQFDSVQYPGYNALPGGAVFVRDYFGMLIDSNGYYNDKGHSLYVTTPNGGSYDISGIAGGGGAFTMFRLQEGKSGGTAKGKLYNCHAFDTNSEGYYCGNTSSPPVFRYQGTEVDKVIAVRAGTDPHQWQHFIGDVRFKRLYAVNSGTWYVAPFQRWQDSGGQIVSDRGHNLIESYFVDGFASNGLSLLGAEPTPDNSGPVAGDETVFNKVYIYDGHRAIYVNNSSSYGNTWRIKELWIGGMSDEYANITGEPKLSYYLEHAGTDKFIIEKLYHDGSRPNIAKDINKFQIGEIVLLNDFPRPKYKFKQRKFINWFEYVANFHPCPDNTKMVYRAGQYVTDELHPEGAENGLPIAFCKCIKDHTATPMRPSEDTTNFVILSWDVNGVASDEEGWDSEATQRPYPPDNYTHTADSPLKDFFWLTAGAVDPVPPVDPEPTPEPPKDVDVVRLTISEGELYAYTADERIFAVGPVKQID